MTQGIEVFNSRNWLSLTNRNAHMLMSYVGRFGPDDAVKQYVERYSGSDSYSFVNSAFVEATHAFFVTIEKVDIDGDGELESVEPLVFVDLPYGSPNNYATNPGGSVVRLQINESGAEEDEWAITMAYSVQNFLVNISNNEDVVPIRVFQPMPENKVGGADRGIRIYEPTDGSQDRVLFDSNRPVLSIMDQFELSVGKYSDGSINPPEPQYYGDWDLGYDLEDVSILANTTAANFLLYTNYYDGLLQLTFQRNGSRLLATYTPTVWHGNANAMASAVPDDAVSEWRFTNYYYRLHVALIDNTLYP